jgi:hypothetical protein
MIRTYKYPTIQNLPMIRTYKYPTIQNRPMIRTYKYPTIQNLPMVRTYKYPMNTTFLSKSGAERVEVVPKIGNVHVW